MGELEQTAAKVKEETVVRFSISQRFEHWLMAIAFTVLVATGLPQLFSDNSLSQWIIQNLGGIYTTRWIHRNTGWVLIGGAVYHIGFIVYHVFVRKRRLSMILTFKDFKDAIAAFRYDLGLTDQQPQYGRYDFRQKFEYWGMVFGTAMMIVSGLILMYPVVVTKFLLPGQFIPAAKTAHGYEGLLALLIILVWHLYSAHVGPEKFPFDATMFTGRISRERLRKEHLLEYEEILKDEASSVPRLPGEGEERDTEEPG